MRPHPTLEEFNASVLEAVDRGLTVLGDKPVKVAFYSHIEKSVHLGREEIPLRLDVFHKAMTNLFFDGTSIIEKRMARELYRILDLSFEENGKWNLSDYVSHAKTIDR